MMRIISVIYNKMILINFFFYSQIITYGNLAIYLVSGFLIILFEMKRSHESYKSFMKNLLVTGVVTIIGAGNIESLNLLKSRVGGLRAFSQDLSDQARDWIYWLSVVGIFTKEIPKFVIQVSNLFFLNLHLKIVI